VHVTGYDAIIQERDLEVRQVLMKLGTILIATERELKAKLPLVAPMGHMEHASISAQPIGPSHGRSLPAAVELLQPKQA
jgi:hypothetical protein